jgi:hypothetical protein
MARVSLILRIMNRWLGALFLTIGGLLFLFPRASEAPAAQQPGGKPASQVPGQNPEPAREAPSVRLEHELVEVVPLAASPPAARAVVHAVDKRAKRSTQPEHFVARARRALMGDGRYRPEPFPRPATR